MVKGIDVSRHQGTVNWFQVKQTGQDFAVARASIGQNGRDDQFTINYPRIVARGLIPGAYHLVTGTSSGEAQAANFKKILDEVSFDKGLLVLDVEGWSETLNGNEAGTLEATRYLCNWIRDTYKRTPIIYTGVYWRDNLKQHPDTFGSELWLSYYGTNDVNLYVPNAWKSKGWKIWQYTEAGTVNGVTGPVDMNTGAGTLRSFQELAGWEWDELATQAEIRAVVSEEISKAIALNASGEQQSTEAVVNALNSVEFNLSNKITNNAAAANVKHNEILLKLSEVSVKLNEEIPEDVTPDEVVSLVNELHRHVCTRSDLHM